MTLASGFGQDLAPIFGTLLCSQVSLFLCTGHPHRQWVEEGGLSGSVYSDLTLQPRLQWTPGRFALPPECWNTLSITTPSVCPQFCSPSLTVNAATHVPKLEMLSCGFLRPGWLYELWDCYQSPNNTRGPHRPH